LGSPTKERLRLKAVFRRETDGRWIADVPEIPGVTAYGATQLKAFAKVRKLALEVIADRLDRGEDVFTGRKTKPASLAPFRLEITPGRLALAR
jgi:predicted RNase H-like HicB family nuclease